MTFWKAAHAVAEKDVRIELRTGEVVVSTGLFAVLVAIIASLSLYVDDEGAKKVAAGVLWMTIAFAGVLAMGRAWAREREEQAMKGLLMSPAPRSAIYLGKAFGTLLFLIAVELVIVPVIAVFFHIDLWSVFGSLVALLFLGTTGFVAAGTLFAVLTVRTRMRDLALTLVVFPLIAPALLAGVVATRELFGGATYAEILGWVKILLAFDIVFVAAGVSLFETLAAD